MAYVRIPSEAARDPQLSPMDKAVLLALCSFADRKGEAFPSLSKIATCAGVNKSSVTRSLQCLENCSYITRQKRKRTGADEFTSTLYTIHGIALDD
jgi:predicted transcriptional regulator